ncbi:MAG: hypothetical protein ABI645_00100 [Pseudomonadota bacterium]
MERPNGFPSDATLEALGARIGEVYLDKRPLFDVEGDDANTSLFRLANRLHIETREATIEEQLLFASGQLYRPRLFEESERILRDTRYLRDASIRPVGYRDGVVDVEVKTQDVWTLNPGVSFGRKGGKNTSGFELEELNVLGFGTQLGIGFKSGLDRDSKQIYYRDRQLGSTWLDLSAKYSDNSDGRLGELNLDHPFYALDTRWAAGGRYRDDQRTDSRYDLGKITDAYETRERYGSVYWGRSKGLVGGWARRYSAGLTYDYRAFLTIPGAAAPTLLPADRKLVQPWLAAEWIQDEFQTTRNRDQIEKTEDYSLGWHLRTQLGYASPGLGSDRSAAILSGSISKGAAPGPRQTVLFNASADGRVEGGAIAAGLLHAEGRYYFRQTPKRLFYASLALESGSNLDVDQQVLLGGDSGLRGYPLRYQAGTGKWLFTAEQRVFTDWYPFQMFNVGGAVFYDMGGTWGRDPLGAPSQGVLKDVGFGLRLGNSRSALGNVLHIDIAFPLDGDSSIKKVQLQIETKRRF